MVDGGAQQPHQQHHHIYEPNGRWRVTKDIPISTVIFITLQTIALVWFLAGQNAKLTSLSDDSVLDKATRYTKDDARHEREFMEQKFQLYQKDVDDMKRRIAILEGQVTEVLSKTRSR